jgi:hypothetical protein
LMSTFTHQFSWAAQVMSCETHHSSSQKSDWWANLISKKKYNKNTSCFKFNCFNATVNMYNNNYYMCKVNENEIIKCISIISSISSWRKKSPGAGYKLWVKDRRSVYWIRYSENRWGVK